MTENNDAADLEALAANPRTDWDVLHWLAENHPELRPTIAANPGTYQELVDALGALGDPAIDEAIALGHHGRDVSSVSAGINPLAGMFDTAIQGIPAYRAQHEGQTGYADRSEAANAQPVYTDIVYNQPAAAAYAGTRPLADDVFQSPDPRGAAPREPQPLAYAAPAHAAAAAPARQPDATDDGQSRRPPLAMIAMVIVGVVAVGALITALITFLGGDDQSPVAEQTSPAAEQTQNDDEAGADQTQGAEETDEADSAETDDPMDQVRTAVTELPEESACQVGDDSAVVGEFITAGTGTDDFPSDDDAGLLEETFSQLQSECSSTHAASVYTAARSGPAYEGETPQGAQSAMDSVGTEWADHAVGLRGAEPMSGFSAQGGNVVCEFDDGVTCTVFSTSPQLCDNGSTYTMTVDGAEVDCGAELETGDRDTLPVGSSATDGFLVCTEMDDRVSCYSSLDSFGFEMSNTGNYTY